MTTSTQLRAHADTADAFEAVNAGALTISISYADLAIIDRLAAQLLDGDTSGVLTLANNPKATAFINFVRRLHT